MARRFLTFNWQHKADAYCAALVEAGWRETLDFSKADFILSDVDVMSRRSVFEKAHKRGMKSFLYPHAGRPTCQYDMYEPYQYTSAHFVIADGHRDVMRAYGYPRPIEVAGWSLCEMRSFYPTEGRQVLFGPIHPNANGWLCQMDRVINARAFDILAALHRAGEINLTVRHIYDLEASGLERQAGIRYEQGRASLEESLESIERADLVVGHQTFAYLAVARGIPTLMMAEDTPPHSGASEAALVWARHWERYRELMKYPLDILATEEPLGLIERAGRTDADIVHWRKRMIGKSFDGPAFVECLEHYL